MKSVVPIPFGWYLFFCFVILAIAVKYFFIVMLIGVLYIIIFQREFFFQLISFMFSMSLLGFIFKHWAISIGIGVFIVILSYFSQEEKL